MCNGLGCDLFFFIVRRFVDVRSITLFGIGCVFGNFRGMVAINVSARVGGGFQFRNVYEEDSCGGEAWYAVQHVIVRYVDQYVRGYAFPIARTCLVEVVYCGPVSVVRG